MSCADFMVCFAIVLSLGLDVVNLNVNLPTLYPKSIEASLKSETTAFLKVSISGARDDCEG